MPCFQRYDSGPAAGLRRVPPLLLTAASLLPTSFTSLPCSSLFCPFSILSLQVQPAGHVSGEIADKVSAWNNEAVVRFLATVGLGEYEELFEEHGVCGVDLLDLTHADLISIGIGALSERKRILRSLNRLHDYV